MIKKVLPGLLILIFLLIDSNIEHSKNILIGIYLLFPILFIIQGFLFSIKKDLLIGISISTIAVLSVPLFYRISPTIILAIIYIILSLITFSIKIKFFKKFAE